MNNRKLSELFCLLNFLIYITSLINIVFVYNDLLTGEYKD